MKESPPANRPSRHRPKPAANESQGQREHMALDLIQRLCAAWTESERVQRRFRRVMLMKLSRLETTVQMIHGGQIAQAHNYMDSDRLRHHAKDAEQHIEERSQKMGLAILRFVDGVLGAPEEQRDRRHKWSDWVI